MGVPLLDFEHVTAGAVDAENARAVAIRLRLHQDLPPVAEGRGVSSVAGPIGWLERIA